MERAQELAADTPTTGDRRTQAGSPSHEPARTTKNEIIRSGNDVRIEKLSYRGWQKTFGRSITLRAPGRLVEVLRRTGAHPGAAVLVHEIPTQLTKLSQWCHGCETYTHKPLSQRFHACPQCGLGSETIIQRDLYSAWLLCETDPIR